MARTFDVTRVGLLRLAPSPTSPPTRSPHHDRPVAPLRLFGGSTSAAALPVTGFQRRAVFKAPFVPRSRSPTSRCCSSCSRPSASPTRSGPPSFGSGTWRCSSWACAAHRLPRSPAPPPTVDEVRRRY